MRLSRKKPANNVRTALERVLQQGHIGLALIAVGTAGASS